MELTSYPSEPDYSIDGLCIRYIGPDQLEVSMAEKQTWKICDGTTFNLATALVYREDYWQIYDQNSYEHGWVYYCKPWPDNQKTWEKIILESDTWQTVIVGNEETERYERRSEFNNFLWEMQLGFLPSRWQYWLSDNWARYDTEKASQMNGLLLVFFAGFMFFIPGGFIITYLLIADCIVRWCLLMVDIDAVGFLPLEIIDRLLYLIYAPLLPEEWNL